MFDSATSFDSAGLRNLLAAAACALAVTGAPALAGDGGRAGGGNVYADAYGNLVIESRAGFKRILVGKGEMAEDYAVLGIEKPRVARLDERRARAYRRPAPCRHGVLVKGRGYMYGLPDGVLPVLTGSCR